MRAFVVLLSVAILGTACSLPPASTSAVTPAPPATVSLTPTPPPSAVDDRGKRLVLGTPAQRIVSLTPGATEILFAIGAGARIVAADDFSDYPEAAKAVPRIGGVRVTAEAIIAQHPDLVLLPTYLVDGIPGLEQANAPTFALESADLEGVYRNIEALAALVDRPAAAAALIADMRSRIQLVASRVSGTAMRPRVLHEVDSTNPVQIFVAGPHNFIDAMITTAGGVNVAGDAAVPYPRLQPEEIVARNPELIVLADAKYGVTPAAVAARPGWSKITAVQRGAIYPIDDDLVSRAGPRLVLGFEAYARLIHPELFK